MPFPPVADAPPLNPEAKFITHDGPIWPVPRDRMRDRQQIIRRMAEDMASIVRRLSADDPMLSSHVIELGWTEQQVSDFGRQANVVFLWQPAGALP